MTEPTYAFGEATAPASGSKILDRLKAKSLDMLKAQVETFAVPYRTEDGIAMSYAVYLSRDDLNLITTANTGSDYDTAVAILVHQCRGLVIDGQVQHNDAGQPLTFQSSDLRDMLGATDTHDAVRKLYGRDGDVSRVQDAVIKACGWDLRAPLDPTGA